MRYSVEIKKFLYSQYFYGGLRIAVGVSLPAILCLIVFHNRELGFTIATGALGACVVDMPGPLKYKHNEMLACSVIGFLAALATGLATVNPVALWCAVVPLTFVLSQAGWRIIGLDSHLPGETGGRVDAAQLQWLKSQLEESPNSPTLLFLHHPPVAISVEWLDRIGLSDTRNLIELIKSSPQIKALCAGHE